jgi:hypothetical protein
LGILNYKTIILRLKYISALCFISAQLLSQNVVIRGRAHASYSGKIIGAYTCSDFITGIRQKENEDTVQKDGFFEVHLQSDYTQPVVLKVENAVARLYVQPDFVYGITVPELEKDLDYGNDAELPLNIGIVGSDSTELNALIFDYQALYNSFFDTKNNRYLNRQNMFRRADSLKKVCDTRYASIKNPYFKSYYEYSIASINASVSRGENFLINNYILNKPIQYHHYEYMQFFNACFTGYLNTIASMRKGESLYNIINVKGSYQLLDEFLAQDKILKNDSLRELVMIKNLWDFYYSADFNPDAIEAIISDLNQKTNNAEHKKITATMLSSFNKMQPGSAAPNFKARTKTGVLTELGSFKGKWIYLNFFSTTNPASLKEMPKIAAIKKKLGDKMIFVSVCLGDSLKSYISYLRANPKFDWNIWYYSDKNIEKNAKEIYSVSGTEAYFLINNLGYLSLSPAPSPSNGIEYRLNAILKPSRRNNKTGTR